MKKLWYLLLAVCTVGAFVACSDDDDNTAAPTPEPEPVPVCPVTDYAVPATAEIGGVFEVTGKGFDATSKLYLRDAAGEDTLLENQTLTETGVECTVPSTLAPAAYTVMLEQSGSWELGSIRLEEMQMPVSGYKVPEEAVLGDKLEITGVGFDETSKIVLVAADGARTELETSLNSAGVECGLPADLAAGTYGVILVQKGRDWTLAESLTLVEPVVPKRLVSFGVDMVEMYMSWTYTFRYDESGALTAIAMTMPIMELPETDIYTVTTSGDRIEVTATEEGLMLAESLYGIVFLPDSFSWEMTDSRITKGQTVVAGGAQSYVYEYDEAGRCTGVTNEGSVRDDSVFEYQNGNCTGLDAEGQSVFAYENPEARNGAFGVDVAQSFLLSSGNVDRSFAFAFGYAGGKSVNLPTTAYGVPITYEYDEDYVISASFPLGEVLGYELKLTYRYE